MALAVDAKVGDHNATLGHKALGYPILCCRVAWCMECEAFCGLAPVASRLHNETGQHASLLLGQKEAAERAVALELIEECNLFLASEAQD